MAGWDAGGSPPALPRPLAAVLLLVPFLVVVVLTWNNSPDDALITARYARNLVEGHGPVDNPGQRVEGFSSPLHLLVVAAVVAVSGTQIVLPLKLASLLFGVVALAVTAVLVRASGLPRGWRAGDGPLRRRCAWFAGPLLAEAALLTARSAYFGRLLPNTYEAEDVPLRGTVDVAWWYVQQLQPVEAWWPGSGRWLLAAQGVLVLAALVGFARRGTLRAWSPVVAVVAAQAVTLAVSGGDWMKGGRFLTPAVPCLVLLLVAGAAASSAAARRAGGRPGALVVGVAATALAAAYALPVTAWFSPYRPGQSLQDTDLLAEGNNGHFGPAWAVSPDLAACAPPGEAVAFSEGGYFSWAQPDHPVVDVRGLTDATIARTAPTALKSWVGVTDREWFRPTSTVGAVLLAERPAVLLSFDTYPVAGPLDGTYRFVGARVVDGLTVSVHQRPDLACVPDGLDVTP